MSGTQQVFRECELRRRHEGHGVQNWGLPFRRVRGRDFPSGPVVKTALPLKGLRV